MVFVAPFMGATALLAGFAVAAPSSYGSSYGGSSDNSNSYGGSSDNSNSYSGSSGSDYSGSDNSNSYNMGGGSAMAATSTAMYEATSTAMSYSTPSYGSGMSSWGGSGYSDCVQQCMMENPPPMQTYSPSMTMNSSDSGYGGSQGSNGATHTVIVAPTQGILRYVPFAVNASVGDTVMFMWGANNHTVTKSSELLPCNKTADAPFVSGEHNKSFIFSQVVNDTSPTFYYCGTPGHCEKGMFGIINPPNANGASSVGNMMGSMMNMSSDMAAMSSYTSMQTANNSAAANWGSNIDMGGMPQWSQQYVAQNVMYTRTFLAANPETITDDGKVNLGAAGQNPLMIPADITAINNAAAPAASVAPAASAAVSPAASAATSVASASGTPAAAAANTPSNGAGALTSPTVLVGLAAVLVSFLAL